MNVSREMTARIAAHLAKVRDNLSGLPADEQKEILQSIEAHIYDALQSKGGDEPSPALLDAILAEMDPPESYNQSPAVAPVSQSSSRPWWKCWWAQLAIGIALALVVRTFFLQAFKVATDAAAPEVPRGSRFLAWKLSYDFAPGYLITYKHEGRVNVGRVVRSENGIPRVNRNGEPDVAVPRDAILGKVISVYWRTSNRASPATTKSAPRQF